MQSVMNGNISEENAHESKQCNLNWNYSWKMGIRHGWWYSYWSILAITSHAKVILYTNGDSTVLDTLYFKEGKKFVYDAVLNEFTYEETDLDEWSNLHVHN